MYVVLIVCVLWCVYALYSRRKRMHELPPAYPGALPIIGHTHLLLLWYKDLYGFLNSMAEFCLKSGGVTYGYFAGNIYYGVVDPEDAATVSNTLTQRHPFLNFAEHLFGQGLLVGHGEKYKLHRRLLNPAFSLPAVNGFLGVFNDQARRMADVLDSHVGHGPVDTIMIFRSLTLSTTCATVFGDNDVKENDFINKYVSTLDILFQSIEERIAKFWLHNDTIFNLSRLKKKQDKICHYLNEITNEVIQRKKIDMKNRVHLGSLSESEGQFKSFIDLMLEIAADGALTDDDIRNELNTIVVTSYETSSQQLIFIASILGSYPEVQDKMYKELMEVVGDRDVEKQDIPKLVYTDAVIKECQRFIPILPLMPRYVDKDLKLKNYTLRAGAVAFFMPIGINQHSAWGPDVNTFKPERWLDKKMQSKLANMNFAFSIGPRSCVGRRYAMTSIKVALAHVIRQFRLKGDYTKIKYSIELVIRAESGHEVTVERRNLKSDWNRNITLSIFEENKNSTHELI